MHETIFRHRGTWMNGSDKPSHTSAPMLSGTPKWMEHLACRCTFPLMAGWMDRHGILLAITRAWGLTTSGCGFGLLWGEGGRRGGVAPMFARRSLEFTVFCRLPSKMQATNPHLLCSASIICGSVWRLPVLLHPKQSILLGLTAVLKCFLATVVKTEERGETVLSIVQKQLCRECEACWEFRCCIWASCFCKLRCFHDVTNSLTPHSMQTTLLSTASWREAIVFWQITVGFSRQINTE